MPVSFDQFCADCESSSLLSAEELAEARTGLGDSTDPQQLVRWLVKQEKLTAFQAQQVYAGKGKSLVLGNYVLLDKLGQGGMGAVYKATHRRMKRVVALKVLSPDLTKTNEAVQRFLREVEASGRLQHPNIVAAHDADCVGKIHFLVMECVEGTDLSSLVKSKGPLAVDKAVHCLVQVAHGLQYAHSQGVVHRDIKPANLLLDRSGSIKILDMGLARISDSNGAAELTQSGAVMGTVDYMPPEQALSSKNADERSDIYSLGISLWYLLTGRAAYDGDSLMAKLLAHQQQPIPSLKSACAAVPQALDRAFQKMVAKRPEDRFQSMAEVIVALEQSLTGAAEAPSVLQLPGETSRLEDFFEAVQGRGDSRTLAPSAKTLQGKRQAASKTVSDRQVTSGKRSEWSDSDALRDSPPPRTLGRRRNKAGASHHPQADFWSRYKLAVITGGVGLLAVVLAVSFGRRTTPAKVPVQVVSPQEKEDIPALADAPKGPAAKAPSPLKWPFDAATAKAGQEAWANSLGKSVVEKNILNMEMVLIPPGSYLMGSPENEPGRNGNERQVPITLSRPFRIGRTEVTIGQFRQFVNDEKYKTEAEISGQGGSGWNASTQEFEFARPQFTWSNIGIPMTDDFPVVNVSWNDATRFCKWLSGREGREYRLPTDAEWEYACRAGTATAYFCGDDPEALSHFANVQDRSAAGQLSKAVTGYGWGPIQADDGAPFAAVVAHYRPNAFGLYDMHGNVVEWCSVTSPANADGRNPVPDSRPDAQVRGGNWDLHPLSARSAHHTEYLKSLCFGSAGFRVVQQLDTLR